MGDTRYFSSICGYEKQLDLGGGLNAINKEFISRVFPDADFSGIGRPIMENALAVCGRCREIMAVPVLKDMDTGKVIKKLPCPLCNGEADLAEEPVKCPQCGSPMESFPAGNWD